VKPTYVGGLTSFFSQRRRERKGDVFLCEVNIVLSVFLCGLGGFARVIIHIIVYMANPGCTDKKIKV